MRKLHSFVIALLLGCMAMNAQVKIDKLSLNYGEEITDDKGKIIKIIGEANNKIYTLVLMGKKDYFLKVFDSAGMKQLSVNPIILPEIKDKDVDFKEVYMLKGKIYVIGSVYHRKDKIYTLIAVQVSEQGELDKNWITLFESQVAKSSDRGDFYFRLSPDEDKLLVMHTALFDKEDAMKYEVKLFDDSMKTAFFAEDKVSFDDNKKDYHFDINDFDVNYDDDVFLVVNEGYRDNKKKERIEKFQIHVFKKTNAYKKEVVDIDLKDKEIINCSMLSTNKGAVKLVGFYSSVRESGRANKELKGVYNATLDLNGNTVQNLVFNEFDYDTKVKLLGERRAKKGKDVKPAYSIYSIIEKNDGGLIVLSEYRMIVVGQKQGIGPLGVQPITYIANEIIVTSLKPDGSLEWSNVVAKEQAATVTEMSLNFFVGGGGNFSVGASLAFPLGVLGKGPEYLSAIPIYRNGQLQILFNDNAKNKGITDIEKIRSMGNYNNAIPTLFAFDDKGVITRKDPEEVEKNQLVIRPGVFHRNNDSEYLIYASRKSKDKLGRLILEK